MMQEQPTRSAASAKKKRGRGWIWQQNFGFLKVLKPAAATTSGDGARRREMMGEG
jgi:hypothetical protein